MVHLLKKSDQQLSLSSVCSRFCCFVYLASCPESEFLSRRQSFEMGNAAVFLKLRFIGLTMVNKVT